MAFTVDPIERRSDEIHRRVAERIRRDPSVIVEAAARLARWIERDGTSPLAVRLEWKAALNQLSLTELADFLESDTPRARRMRVSSPFFGLER